MRRSERKRDNVDVAPDAISRSKNPCAVQEKGRGSLCIFQEMSGNRGFGTKLKREEETKEERNFSRHPPCTKSATSWRGYRERRAPALERKGGL